MNARAEAEEPEPPQREMAQTAPSPSLVLRARAFMHTLRDADEGSSISWCPTSVSRGVCSRH